MEQSKIIDTLETYHSPSSSTGSRAWGTSSCWTCAEHGGAVRSVLGSVGSWRRSTASTALLNASAFGLRGYVDTLSLLVAMLLLDRSCVIVGFFLKYYVPRQWYQFPGLCVDIICMSRTQRVVGDNSHTAYHQHLTLIWRYCWMKWPGPTLHDRIHETGSTDVLRT